MNRDRNRPRPRRSGEPAHGLRADTQRNPAAGAPTEQLDIERERRLNLEVIKEVLADLADVGFQVDSLRELRHSGQEYRRAVPILLDWLQRVERRDVKEEIVRTLSMPFAKEALPVLLREFEFGEDPTGWLYRWTVGNAIEVLADDSVFEPISRLVRDRRFGRAREMLVEALAKMKDRRTPSLLVELLDDKDVAGHALHALRKLKASVPREVLAPFLDDRRGWVRAEARKLMRYAR